MAKNAEESWIDDAARLRRRVKKGITENDMSQTIAQAIMWILTLGALVLYMQRRRKRKTDY